MRVIHRSLRGVGGQYVNTEEYKDIIGVSIACISHSQTQSLVKI